MALIHFMQRPVGRLARGAAGAAMVAIGAGLGGAWWALAAVGLVPLAAGLGDVCLLAPLFGAPVRHAPHGA